MRNIKVIIGIAMLVFSYGCGDGFSESRVDSAIIGGTGKGGSLARFAISGDRLYTIEQEIIKTFDISDRQNMVYKSDTYIGFGIETLFPYNGNLFVGAQDGMYIYDLSDRDNPQWISYYAHFLSCDPVVVQGNYAYVTLRVSECRPSQSFDALEIIDISDIYNPIQINSYELNEPYGLGVSGDLLFVCEGDNGLKVLDISNPYSIEMVKQFSGIHAYDVIPHQNILILTGEDGIRQYDFSDPQDITLLSEIYSSEG